MSFCVSSTIESVSEVLNMKKWFYGFGLGLSVNYLLHQMNGPAVYFGLVFCGLLVFYCRVQLDEMVKDALIRFALLLIAALFYSVDMDLFSAVSWFVLCAFSSGISQCMMRYSYESLEKISCINMVLLGTVFCCVLMSKFMGWNMSLYLMLLCALFQPSHLPLVHPFEMWHLKEQ